MKIQSVASPHLVQDKSTPESVRTARAVEAFNKGQSSYDKQTVTQTSNHSVNQNNISPEELSAVKPQSQDTSSTLEATQENQPDTTPQAKAEPPQEQPLETDRTELRRFQQLARAERAARQKAQAQAQELQKDKAAFESQRADFEARLKAYEQGYISRDRLKLDALSALEDAGVSYDDVTQQAITRQPTDPRVMSTITRLEAKIADLESKAQIASKTAQDQQQAAYQSALKQIRADATELVKSNPDEYEAISKTNSVKDVVELIERTYNKEGRVMSVEEAAQAVEDYLVDEGVNISRIGKIKKRIEQSNASTGQSTQKTPAQTQTQPQMKTLTNAAASTRKLSARERALLAFKNELK